MPDGRVNLIGCNVGAGEKGAELVFKLSKIIGAQVRAAVGFNTADMTTVDDYDGPWQTADPSMSQPPDPIPTPDGREWFKKHTVGKRK